jgi:hypothetical protein
MTRKPFVLPIVTDTDRTPLGQHLSQCRARNQVLAYTTREQRIAAISRVIERLWHDLSVRDVRGDSPSASVWREPIPRIH